MSESITSALATSGLKVDELHDAVRSSEATENRRRPAESTNDPSWPTKVRLPELTLSGDVEAALDAGAMAQQQHSEEAQLWAVSKNMLQANMQSAQQLLESLNKLRASFGGFQNSPTGESTSFHHTEAGPTASIGSMPSVMMSPQQYHAGHLPQGGISPQVGHHLPAFDDIDVNKDGIISRKEWAERYMKHAPLPTVDVSSTERLTSIETEFEWLKQRLTELEYPVETLIVDVSENSAPQDRLVDLSNQLRALQQNLRFSEHDVPQEHVVALSNQLRALQENLRTVLPPVM